MAIAIIIVLIKLRIIIRRNNYVNRYRDTDINNNAQYWIIANIVRMIMRRRAQFKIMLEMQ